MTREFQFVICSAVIGIGATLVLDLWGLLQRRLLGLRPLDMKLLGRWLGYIPLGRFAHRDISKAAPLRGEAIVGWVAHYSIGCSFAALLLLVCGLEWAARPTFVPALLIGLGTVIAPLFIMQPSFGAGFAGSKTPNPNLTRARSLATHVVYGVGLYVSALAWAALME